MMFGVCGVGFRGTRTINQHLSFELYLVATLQYPSSSSTTAQYLSMDDNAGQLSMERSYSSQALALISSSNLALSDKRILQAFVEDAVDPKLSAEYLLKSTGSLSELDNGKSKDLRLYQFLNDWTTLSTRFQPTACDDLPRAVKALVRARDGSRCCFTGLPSRFFGRRPLIFTCIVPPSAFTCTKTAHLKHLDDMLDAFITPEKRQWACSLFGNASSADCSEQPHPEHRIDNLWLLSSDVYRPFSQGRVQFTTSEVTFAGFPLPKSEYINPYTLTSVKAVDASLQQTYRVGYLPPWSSFQTVLGLDIPIGVTLKNRSPNLCALPNPELFGLHNRFAKAIAYKLAREEMKEGWPSTEEPKAFMSAPLRRLLQNAWLKVPPALRVWTYEIMKKIGCYMYGPTKMNCVQRLPFNLFLKWSIRPAGHVNEARAMDLLEEHTEVPAPRAIDRVRGPELSYLLMTGLPGTMLGSVLYRFTDAELVQLVEDLRRIIWQMRSIRNPYRPDSVICNAAGLSCYDFRINDSVRRDNFKFESEAKFNECLTSDVTDEARQKAASAHSIAHEICFTHGDLNMQNILVDKGKLSGIVDWENAGWFPEYWDYTKIRWVSFRALQRYLNDVVDRVFPDYKLELEGESALWQYVYGF